MIYFTFHKSTYSKPMYAQDTTNGLIRHFLSSNSFSFCSFPVGFVLEDFLPFGRPRITPSAFFLAKASFVR